MTTCFNTGICTDTSDTTQEDFSVIEDFEPDSSGGTASTQGIIQGARLAYEGSNAKRLIIIMTDGDDNNKTITNNLVNMGNLCDNIRSKLNAIEVTVDDVKKNVQSRIALIGFGYNPNSNQGLTDCVESSDNIYEANSSGELKTAILSLITEEIGRLAND